MVESKRRDRQVLAGIVVGAAFGIVYSLFVVIAYALRDGETLGGTGLALPTLVILYLSGGIVGGGIVGWLLPYSHNRVGSIVVGVVGALPVFLGLATAMKSELYAPYRTAVLAAILVGGIVGHQALFKRQ